MNLDDWKVSKKYLKSYYIPFIFLFAIAFIISSRVGIFSGDDEVFANSFVSNGGIFGWFKNYTAMWSGRVVPHFILIVLLNIHLIFWRVINSFMFSFMAVGIFLLISKNDDSEKNKVMTAWVICSLIFFIPVGIMYPGGVWITGAVTYLWPMACAFIAIVPFKRLITGEESSKSFIIISIISTIYASYSEQSAAIMIAFETLILVYCFFNKTKTKWYNYLSYVLCLINSLYSLTVIGNSVRSQAEALKYYPDYDMLSMVDKGFLGVRTCFNELYNNRNVFMLMITVIIVMFIGHIKVDCVTKLMAIFSVAYVSLNFLDVKEIYKFNDVNPLYIGGIKQYLSYIAAIMTCLIILYLFYIIFEREEFIIVSLMFLAAVCCSVVMGFSPTVYASGKRIFFATNVLLILCVAALFRRYMQKYKINNMLYVSFLLISLALAIRFIVFMTPMWI